jgi:hypothetical protein
MPTQEEINVQTFESVVKIAALSGNMPLPWYGTIKLARIAAKSGEWYFGVECKGCKRTSPAFRDWSDGKLGNCFRGTGEVLLKCHFCTREIRARAGQLVTAQWP